MLAVESLSCLFQQAHAQGSLKGFRISQSCPSLTHLLFAEDALLFGKASEEEAYQLVNILNAFTTATGQMISVEKSGVIFSKNCLYPWHMGVWDYPGKYLGLPAEWGRSRSQTLNWLKLRVLDKIDGWKEKLLIQAGKNVLIKSVLQAIPSYAMAIIRFPSSFCKSISSHIARFWWRRPGKERGTHWKVWNFISKAKGKGGLGFKDFSLMNTALLAKQAWRAYKNPSSLWVLVLQGLYYPQTNFLQAKCRRGASWGWRSLVQGRDFLLEHGRWLVGTGKKINVWNDKWIGNELIPMPVGSKPCLTVNSLLAESQIAWDSHKLLSLLPRLEALQALRIPISILGEEDQFCWPHEGWKLLCQNRIPVSARQKPLKQLYNRSGSR